jgi:hypothetical protein
MLSRNDNPLGMKLNFATDSNFNFAIDNPFISSWNKNGNIVPPSGNFFLLSDGSNFLLSDNTNFLLS